MFLLVHTLKVLKIDESAYICVGGEKMAVNLVETKLNLYF